jgi:hypothetical protein
LRCDTGAHIFQRLREVVPVGLLHLLFQLRNARAAIRQHLVQGLLYVFGAYIVEARQTAKIEQGINCDDTVHASPDWIAARNFSTYSRF